MAAASGTLGRNLSESFESFRPEGGISDEGSSGGLHLSQATGSAQLSVERLGLASVCIACGPYHCWWSRHRDNTLQPCGKADQIRDDHMNSPGFPTAFNCRAIAKRHFFCLAVRFNKPAMGQEEN